jgi:hypothetical protein
MGCRGLQLEDSYKMDWIKLAHDWV